MKGASCFMGLQGLKDRITAPLSKGYKVYICTRAVISQLGPWVDLSKIQIVAGRTHVLPQLDLLR